MFKKQFFLRELYNNYISKYKNNSYSQEGEDLVLARLFYGVPSGYYIDIGAHHPFRFSNTYLFYLKGWKGINIDANPDCIHLFNKFRSRDININIGVAKENSEMIFYKFDEPALNSFDKILSKTRESEGWHIHAEIPVKLSPLKDILKKHLPAKSQIDFMSIDVEGFDLQVLESNDWNAYRPKYILAECLNTKGESFTDNEIYKFLVNKNGYDFFAKTVNTFFFIDRGVA